MDQTVDPTPTTINLGKRKTEQLDPVKLKTYNKWVNNACSVDDNGSFILILDKQLMI